MNEILYYGGMAVGLLAFASSAVLFFAFKVPFAVGYFSKKRFAKVKKGRSGVLTSGRLTFADTGVKAAKAKNKKNKKKAHEAYRGPVPDYGESQSTELLGEIPQAAAYQRNESQYKTEILG